MIHRERTFANVGMWFLRCPFPPKYNGRSRFFTAFPHMSNIRDPTILLKSFEHVPTRLELHGYTQLSQHLMLPGLQKARRHQWIGGFSSHVGLPGKRICNRSPRVPPGSLCFLMFSCFTTCFLFAMSIVLKLQSQWLQVRKELALLLKEHFAGNLGCVPISVQTPY